MDYISAVLISSKNESSSTDAAFSDEDQNTSTHQTLLPFQVFRNGSSSLPTSILRETIMLGISNNEGDEIFMFSGTSVNATNATPSLETSFGSDDTELTWSTWLLVAFLSTLIVITTVGNLLVCLSVCLVKKLRKPQNYLLVSLAISDLFVAVFVMPFAIAFELNGGTWPFNHALCDLWVSADVLCCTASILNLCGISVDRYRSISTPLDYSSKTTPRRMLAVIFVVWLGSACVTLPPVLLLGNVHYDSQGNSFCSLSQNFWYQIYATMASFYVPLCVMVVVYVKILHVVADKKKQRLGWKPVHHRLSNRHTPLNHKEKNRSQVGGERKGKIKIKNNPVSIAENPQTYALVTYTVGTTQNPSTVTTTISPSSSTSSSPTRQTSVSVSTMSTLLTIPTPPTVKHSSTQSGSKNDGIGGVGIINNNHNKQMKTPGSGTPGNFSVDSKNSIHLSKSFGKGVKTSSSSPNRQNKRKSVTLNTCTPLPTSHNDNNLSPNPQPLSSANGSSSHVQNSPEVRRPSAVTHFFSTVSMHEMRKRQKEKLLDRLREHKASATLGIIMLTFIICWLPFFVLALIRPFLTINDIEIPVWMYTLFNWLGYANSALNPVIYATLNRDFRKPFREILCLRCSTLDDMMRREFYRQQYGDDLEQYTRRVSKSQTEEKTDLDDQTPLSPTSV